MSTDSEDALAENCQHDSKRHDIPGGIEQNAFSMICCVDSLKNVMLMRHSYWCRQSAEIEDLHYYFCLNPRLHIASWLLPAVKLHFSDVVLPSIQPHSTQYISKRRYSHHLFYSCLPSPSPLEKTPQKLQPKLSQPKSPAAKNSSHAST